MNKLASSIYLIRVEKKLSQKQLAQKSGVPQPNISQIEKGRDFRVSTLYKIAAALDVTPNELMDGIKPIPINKKTLFRRKNIEDLAKDLPGNHKDAALQQLAQTLQTTLSAHSGRKNLHLSWIKLKRTFKRDELDSVLSRIDKAQQRRSSHADAE